MTIVFDLHFFHAFGTKSVEAVQNSHSKLDDFPFGKLSRARIGVLRHSIPALVRRVLVGSFALWKSDGLLAATKKLHDCHRIFANLAMTSQEIDHRPYLDQSICCLRLDVPIDM